MTCEYCDQPITGDKYSNLEHSGVIHEACKDLYEMFLQRRKVQDTSLEAFRSEPWVKDLEANGNINSTWCGNCEGCCN